MDTFTTTEGRRSRLNESRTIGLAAGHMGASRSRGGKTEPRSERVYSYDLELTPDGKLKFLRVDEDLLEIWGYTLAELQQNDWSILILPRDVERIATIIRIARNGGLWTGRIRTTSRDGTIRVFALHLEPEVLADRTLVRAIARDVTDAALATLTLQENEVADALVAGDLWIDPSGFIVKKRGEEISVTITEFKLLLEFARNPGRVLKQQSLAERVWGHEFISTSNVPMLVKRLRDKIEDDPRSPSLIETVRGLGYRMRLPEA